MKIVIKDIGDLHQAARKFIGSTKGYKIFAFYGQMGAGKTTFIKSLCEALGAEDVVTSPTFTLVNEYRTTGGDPIYHIDFYRIRKTEEVFDFGIEEYFSSGNYCFMEWPELIEELLPPGTVKVRINVEGDEQRTVEFD